MTKGMTKGFAMRLLPALIMAGFAGVAGAAGFALQNQTGSGNGNAFAGAAAAAEDAGTIFFNPAGMTYLREGHSISAAATVLNRAIKFSDEGTAAVPTFAKGSNGGDAGGTSVIPAGYYAYSVTPRLRLGLGVSPTFGNKTEYDDDFIGRFSGYFAEMKQININPSIAYKLNDVVSLGAGVNFAHNETEFEQMAVVGAGASRVANLKGDDWAAGYNLGTMFQVSPNTRIGLSYRSKIKFKLEGDFEVAGVSTRPVKATLEMPDSASLAVSQKLSDRWELLGDLTWTGWGSIDTIRVTHADTGAQITTLPYRFKDTWRVGLGANYQYNDRWKLRFGVAHDETPVRTSADRTMTLPDSDRTWLSFGAKWALSKATSLDFGYSHIFFKNTSTTRTATTALGTQTVRGEWNNNRADLLSVQLNHSF